MASDPTTGLKCGWLTKRGKVVKNWKKRWFVLTSDALSYYASNKPGQEPLGTIKISKLAFVKREVVDKKRDGISITAGNRVYQMYPDDPSEIDSWIAAISDAIKSFGSNTRINENTATPTQEATPATVASSSNVTDATSASTPNDPKTSASTEPQSQATTPSDTSNTPNYENQPRQRVRAALEHFSFIKSSEYSLSDVWNAWLESIPLGGKQSEGSVYFSLIVPLECNSVTLRAHGPQHSCIEKMVEFFEKCRVKDEEVDFLNEIGPRALPTMIGSWVEFSTDTSVSPAVASKPTFGWYFPTDVPFDVAVSIAEQGDATHKLSQWLASRSISNAVYIQRSMQSDDPQSMKRAIFHFNLTGSSAQQLEVASSLFSEFQLPPLGDKLCDAVKSINPSSNLLLCVSICASGVERVSVIVRNIKFDVINVIAEALSVSTASVTSVAKAIDVVRAADVAGSHALEIAYCAKGENNTPRLSLHLFCGSEN